MQYLGENSISPSTFCKRYHSHSEICIFGYSVGEMYAVISDVEKYDKFLPWCRKSLVHSSSHSAMEATLHVGFLHFSESYTSKVDLIENKRILTSLCGQNTMLQSLQCCWEFNELSKLSVGSITGRKKKNFHIDSLALPRDHFAQTKFHVEFRFVNAAHSAFCTAFKDKIVLKIIKSFERRLFEVHGRPAFVRIPL